MRPSVSFLRGLRATQPSLPRSAISRSASRSLSHLTYRSTRPSLASSASSSPLTVLKNRTLLPSFTTIRQNSDSAKPLTDKESDAARDAENEEQNRKRREEEPAYQLIFTCKPCGERSAHRISKHGYHRGTVLVRCPSCKNRHVMSDHLNIFFDEKTTIESILEKQGDKVTTGYLDGDMEFWDDGVAHKRSSSSGSGTASS